MKNAFFTLSALATLAALSAPAAAKSPLQQLVDNHNLSVMSPLERLSAKNAEAFMSVETETSGFAQGLEIANQSEGSTINTFGRSGVTVLPSEVVIAQDIIASIHAEDDESRLYR